MLAPQTEQSFSWRRSKLGRSNRCEANLRLPLIGQKLRNRPLATLKQQARVIMAGAAVVHGREAFQDAARESIRACLLGEASTVRVERSKASNTFTARSEPHNRAEIHACRRLETSLTISNIVTAFLPLNREHFRTVSARHCVRPYWFPLSAGSLPLSQIVTRHNDLSLAPMANASLLRAPKSRELGVNV